jgi:hypothetical protein
MMDVCQLQKIREIKAVLVEPLAQQINHLDAI